MLLEDKPRYWKLEEFIWSKIILVRPCEAKVAKSTPPVGAGEKEEAYSKQGSALIGSSLVVTLFEKACWLFVAGCL